MTGQENESELIEPARYISAPLSRPAMGPGLFKLGTCFGNGRRDPLVFQRDRQFLSYKRAKKDAFSSSICPLNLTSDVAAHQLRTRAYAWMKEQLAKDLGRPLEPALPERESAEAWESLSLQMQEDFALLHQPSEGGERLVLLSVCFPSGWAPEEMLGGGFLQTHAAIPDFEPVNRVAPQLVRAMVERGPYVRFVWSVSRDSRLDHHPKRSPAMSWADSPMQGDPSEPVLRIERQLTIPFAEVRGSLFLIRTYLYPLSSLEEDELAQLRAALVRLSPAVAAYKGLKPLNTVLSFLKTNKP